MIFLIKNVMQIKKLMNSCIIQGQRTVKFQSRNVILYSMFTEHVLCCKYKQREIYFMIKLFSC
jgi:hypothetical protein